MRKTEQRGWGDPIMRQAMNLEMPHGKTRDGGWPVPFRRGWGHRAQHSVKQQQDAWRDGPQTVEPRPVAGEVEQSADPARDDCGVWPGDAHWWRV